ncbi:MAG: pyrroline-5-carboxylate reductase, partial [Acidiferrobacterales bacterium]|nr:pyrroline-5-carboxylate reductase [Acidiferrobacterales bacterium]
MLDKKIGFIGAGNMARSLASGLVNNGLAPDLLSMSDPDAGTREAIAAQLGVSVSPQNSDIVEASDILVFAVKPQVLKEVALGLTEVVQKKQPLVVSIAAGIRSDSLENWLGGNLPLVRVMPNTAALIGSGASGLYANARVDKAARNIAETIMRAVGVVAWVSDEKQLDIVTALSGSGPAYFFLVMEALEQAAIDAGLSPDIARLLTLETAYGAAKMALEGGEEPAKLRQQVTSKGGTTERAIAVMEENGIRDIYKKAIFAAAE